MTPTTESYLKKDAAKSADVEATRSLNSVDDAGPSIGARVQIEGVVVGRRNKYGVSVRLPDGTIQSFSHLAFSQRSRTKTIFVSD